MVIKVKVFSLHEIHNSYKSEEDAINMWCQENEQKIYRLIDIKFYEYNYFRVVIIYQGYRNMEVKLL